MCFVEFALARGYKKVSGKEGDFCVILMSDKITLHVSMH